MPGDVEIAGVAGVMVVTVPRHPANEDLFAGFPRHPANQDLFAGTPGRDAAYNPKRRFDMQYLLTLYADENGFNNLTPEQRQQGMAAYMAYTQALQAAGVYKGSNRLRPVATATTLRTTDGKVQVLDGPFIESKEQLGGYFLIDVPNLDAAITWASKCPGVGHGVVEVRAIWDMSPGAAEKERPEALAAAR